MRRIWGRLSSINVRKVVWTAGEVGVAFERVEAGASFGGLDTAEYARINPNRMIPVLDDDGYLLWESNVIVRYLCARYAPQRLYPQDLPARFEAERWMDWQQTTLNPAGRGAFMQLIRTPVEARDAAAIERSRSATEPLLALLDAHLGSAHFLAGAQFTMADIPVGCEVHRWFGLPLARPRWPNLQRWYETVAARPAAAAVLSSPLS